MEEGIQHTTVRANGINIHLAEKGQGPVVLLLHGFPRVLVLLAPSDPRPRLSWLPSDGNFLLQAPGAIEVEFAEIGTDKVLNYFLTSLPAAPLYLPKGKAFKDQLGIPITLPSWLSEEELNCYVTKYEITGFTGGLNYYRNLHLSWELTAPWTESRVEVPAKFTVGDLDVTYNTPGFNLSMTFNELKKHVPLLEDVVVMKGVGHFLHEEKADEINQHIHDFFQKF